MTLGIISNLILNSLLVPKFGIQGAAIATSTSMILWNVVMLYFVIRKTKIKIILVPLCVIVGSLFGAAIISFFISEISVTEAMAIGAGFGYYSLSSIFITEISGETLGVIALLSNISREIITLLATPFFVKHFGKLGGIASGGATSMDTCLPIISESTGKEWAIFENSFVCSRL